MGSGGHNRKPTILHMQQGTYRADRANPNEPTAMALPDVPRPPSHLNRYAKRKWKELAPVLSGSRIMTDHDLVALEMLCEAYGQYRESQWAVYHTIGDDGKAKKRNLAEYMDGRNSQTMPEYAAMTRAIGTVRGLLSEFGMSPASRAKVSAIPDKNPEDEMSRLLEGQG